MLNQYDEDYEIYGDSFVEDSEYILEICDIEDGIDKVYIMMQDMIKTLEEELNIEIRIKE